MALRSRIGAKMTPENERGPPAGHPDASSISKASDASVAPVNPQEQLLLRGYQPLTQLGAGNFGRALLVLREELPYVAKMQRYHNLRLKDKRNIAREVQNMRAMSYSPHPNVVRMIESFVDGYDLCIIMDFCNEGDLAAEISRQQQKQTYFPEATIKRWLVQLLSGLDRPMTRSPNAPSLPPPLPRLYPADVPPLPHPYPTLTPTLPHPYPNPTPPPPQPYPTPTPPLPDAHTPPLPDAHKPRPISPTGLDYLHFAGILHRDIKPSNAFLHNGQVKLGDLGLSKQVIDGAENGALVHTQCGTPLYVAPEVHMHPLPPPYPPPTFAPTPLPK